MSDVFGDRMKKYEQIEAGRIFLPNLPILVRIDGKGFSKYTKKLNKPYDIRFSDIMINVTKFLVKQTNACIGYTQSDEITLVLYAKELNQEIFFAGKIQKMVSVISSMATAKFNQLAMNELPQDLVHEIDFLIAGFGNYRIKLRRQMLSIGEKLTQPRILFQQQQELIILQVKFT